MSQSNYYPNLVIFFPIYLWCVCKSQEEKTVGVDEKKASRGVAGKKTDLWEKIWDLEMEQERMRAEGEEAHKENDSFRN